MFFFLIFLTLSLVEEEALTTNLAKCAVRHKEEALHLTHGAETADHLDSADYTGLQYSSAILIEEVHLIDEQQCHL